MAALVRMGHVPMLESASTVPVERGILDLCGAAAAAAGASSKQFRAASTSLHAVRAAEQLGGGGQVLQPELWHGP